jgi:hypothetical protein
VTVKPRSSEHYEFARACFAKNLELIERGPMDSLAWNLNHELLALTLGLQAETAEIYSEIDSIHQTIITFITNGDLL